MQNRPSRVHRLKIGLHLERLEGVFRVGDGQLRGIRVVRLGVRPRLEDAGEALAVFLRETVRGAFCRSGLEVVQISRRLLVGDEAVADALEHAQGEGVAPLVGDVAAVVREVANHLVHPVDADRREVVVQVPQIAQAVGVQAGVHKLLDLRPLLFERRGREVRQMVQAREKPFFVARIHVSEPRQIDRDDADRAGQLGRAEEAVAAGEQLAQIQLEAAAHRTDHARVQLRIDEVLEIGQAVFGRHLEHQLGVRRIPVEVLRHVVRRDREGEDPAVCVALGHHLDVGAVDHVHLGLQLAVREFADLLADVGVVLGDVGRARPVEREVGERALAPPARGHVEVEDELLDALFNLTIGHSVEPYEGRHVGVERGERLGAGPFVLQRPQEVDDLPACRGKVLWRARGNRTGNPVESLFEQTAQRPPRAVAGQHVEVVDVVIAFAVGEGLLLAVDGGQPIVRNGLPRRVEDEAAQRVPLIRVGVDPPVRTLEVLVHSGDCIDYGEARRRARTVALGGRRLGGCVRSRRLRNQRSRSRRLRRRLPRIRSLRVIRAMRGCADVCRRRLLARPGRNFARLDRFGLPIEVLGALRRRRRWVLCGRLVLGDCHVPLLGRGSSPKRPTRPAFGKRNRRYYLKYYI